MRTAKIFKYGNSQAVRLPKEFRFDGHEVLIKRTAAGVLLLPMKITRERLAAALAPLRGTFERRQPAMQASRTGRSPSSRRDSGPGRRAPWSCR